MAGAVLYTDPLYQPTSVRPVRLHNRTGAWGFWLSILGLLTVGLISPIALFVSLVGLRRQPRTLAVFGVILGLVGMVPFLFISAPYVMYAAKTGELPRVIFNDRERNILVRIVPPDKTGEAGSDRIVASVPPVFVDERASVVVPEDDSIEEVDYAAETEPTHVQAGIGEVLDLGNLRMEVIDTERVEVITGPHEQWAAPGNEFLIVTVAVRNDSRRFKYFNGGDFELLAEGIPGAQEPRRIPISAAARAALAPSSGQRRVLLGMEPGVVVHAQLPFEVSREILNAGNVSLWMPPMDGLTNASAEVALAPAVDD